MTCGIYLIKNKNTGQLYVGQSTDIETRWINHCKVSDIDMAIAQQGKENFDLTILQEVDKDDLLKCEKYWIEYFNVYDTKHYNKPPSNQYVRDKPVLHTFWNRSCCDFSNEKSRKRNKPFRYKYGNYKLPIGMFHDFLTCEIISEFVQKSI